MPGWLTTALAWLAKQIISVMVARAAGRADAEAAATRRTSEIMDAQAELAARGGAGRDDVLDRMRDGKF